jgi:D-amino-acid dehydrogenase
MKRILVVGAGAIGLACAYSLARRGHRVTVVDKGEPGAACTRGNAGWIVPSLSAPIAAPGMTWTSLKWMLSSDSPLYIAPSAAPRLARWLWRFWRHCNERDYLKGLHAVAALNHGTLAAFDALANDGVPFELHRAGLLCVYRDAKYMEAARGEFRYLRDYGYGVPEPLSGEVLRQMEPGLSDAVTAGFEIPEEYHVRPESLAAGYATALARMGVEIRTGVSVRGGHTSGKTIIVETADGATAGEIEADDVLVAAGAWSGAVIERLGVRLPVQAGKGYSLTMSSDGARVRRPVLLGESKIAVTPFDGALRFAGTMELSGVNERFDVRRMAAIRRGVERFFREPMPAGGTEWVGMRPLTPDGLPLLGRVPRLENVWVATGHAMLGITMAPVTGDAMAAMMSGETAPAAMAAFEPGRFRW